MQLSKKFIVLVAILAVASVSVVPIMDAVANELPITKVNKVEYSAIMPVSVDMKPGETKSIPVEIVFDESVTVDLFISSEGKEFVARNSLEDAKFTEGISATINKSRSSLDSKGTDNVEIIVSISADAEAGQYPITLAMKQKVIGGSNLVQQYLYVNVE
jgi:uncharacterized membrane protein